MAAPTVSYEYDELRLALQWPTSYYNTGKIRCNPHIPHELTVHGLWPNSYSDNIFTCPTPNASIKNLYGQVSSDLRKDLENYWPNLNSGPYPEYLWEHEYETHGYCFTEFSNPVVYFETALSIATYITKNIKPTISLRPGFYRVKDFRQVTVAGGILILGLRCNYAKNGANPQLLEIVFCTDTNKYLKNCTYDVYACDDQWWDSRSGVFWSGWFQVPEVPASLSGSPRSPPESEPKPLPSAIAPCNSPLPPHKFFSLSLLFYLFFTLNG